MTLSDDDDDDDDDDLLCPVSLLPPELHRVLQDGGAGGGHSILRCQVQPNTKTQN